MEAVNTIDEKWLISLKGSLAPVSKRCSQVIDVLCLWWKVATEWGKKSTESAFPFDGAVIWEI